ncbi:MAG: hypothetical protein QXV32_08045 [Conexivisphaerales archaeon]
MQEKLKEILEGKIVAINLGLDLFADELEKQGIKTVRVKFTPKHSVEKELQDILDAIS